MARKTFNECVDCGKPCIGILCPYRNVERFFCDSCDSEGVLYEYDGEEICLDCVIKKLKQTQGDCVECGDEDCTLYEYDDKNLCINCLESEMCKVEESNVY